MSIDTRGPEFSQHAALFALPKTLIGGTQAMRQAGTRYLPKGQAEAQADYDYRLAHTFLIDSYVRTLNYLTGQVFSRDPEIEDPSPEFEAFAEDVDKRGNNLAVWAQQAFRAGVHAGVTFILVDYSKVQTREGAFGTEYYDAASDTWKPRTVAAREANGWGPYLVNIAADDVIDAWWEMVGGKPVLTHFRFFESVEVQKDEWTRESVQQIRVLTPGAWQTFRRAKGTDGKEQWMPHESGTTTMKEILVAVFAPGERIGMSTARPALEGLAELCAQHWQASSGHRGMMDWLRRPIMFGKAMSQEDGFTLPAAPGLGLHSSDPNADLKAVNVVPPESVTVSASDLKDLETQMGLYGLRLMAPKSGNVTAFQVRREASESDSTLTRWALAFQDALEQALVYVGMWLEQEPPSVSVNTEFDVMLDDIESNTLMAAVQAGIIPRQLAFDEIKRRGLVRSEMDWEEAQAMMENDARSSRLAAPASAAALASGLLGQPGTQE
ncbi:MAG TPA: DUF4055 domain-containing protein [Dissulfurispiraceae bacterium]|nr:DUF4055 domain-containing protein [Dissulfurispiraceae bacterium]